MNRRIYYATISGPRQVNYYAEYSAAWGIRGPAIPRERHLNTQGFSGVSKEGLELEQYGSSGRTHTLRIEDEILPVRVFKGFLTLPYEEVEDYFFIVSPIGEKNQFMIHCAYYNGRFYISYTQVQYHISRGRMLPLKLSFSNVGSEPMDWDGDFNDYSIMKLYGYAVGAKGLKTTHRHTIISFLIDQGIMHSYDIVSHLQGQITLKSEIPNKDYSRSIRDWRDDIMFTHDYKSQKNNKLKTFMYERPEG